MANVAFNEYARLKHLFKVTGVSSETSVLNNGLVYEISGISMLPSEVARLPISSYRKADCTIKEKFEVKAKFVSKGKVIRLFVGIPPAPAPVDKYLEYRLAHKHGASLCKTAYRTLDHEPALLRIGQWEQYRLSTWKTKIGVLSDSSESFRQPFCKLQLLAYVEGAIAMLGRGSFVTKCRQEQNHFRRISELLGNENPKEVNTLLDANTVRLGELVVGAI
jgi:hypothetical protein